MIAMLSLVLLHIVHWTAILVVVGGILIAPAVYDRVVEQS